MWILSQVLTLPKLQHMPKYRDFVKSHRNHFPLGLFLYPVLQAADILLYNATDVPVGDDQAMHIELTRDVVHMFNVRYGTILTLPQKLLGTQRRIKDLRHPELKMSKSDMTERGRISLLDGPDVVVEKLKKAKSDSNSQIMYDPAGRLGLANLFHIYNAITACSVEEIEEKAKHMDTLEFKMIVAKAVNELLGPVQQRYAELMSDGDYVRSVLAAGAERARHDASITLKSVYEKCGLF